MKSQNDLPVWKRITLTAIALAAMAVIFNFLGHISGNQGFLNWPWYVDIVVFYTTVFLGIKVLGAKA